MARRTNLEHRAVEAERATLGAVLLAPEAWSDVASVLRAADFAREDHRLIFGAIAAVAASGRQPDSVTVSDHLIGRSQLEAAGGADYLARLIEEAHSAANAATYAQMVRQAARTRSAIAALTEGAAAAAKADSIDDILPTLVTRLTGLYELTNDRALRSIGIGELLELELPRRSDLLAPWLPRQGLAMVHARRGVGKTHFALAVAWAIATGSEFLRWRAPEPAGVIYVDGEMPAVSMQERLAKLVSATGLTPKAPLDVVTPDLQSAGMPDLASIDGQRLIDRCVRDEHALIVVDNISSLARAGKENEAESWSLIQGWALAHRRKGRSVLFVHHSGKGGLQRGTSRREDNLDTVIALRHPVGYEANEGARFEVHFEKNRGFNGADAESFESQLTEDADGRAVWTIRDASRIDQIESMARDGMGTAEIATELGLNRSTVYRQINAAVEAGRLPDELLKRRGKRSE